MCLIKNLFTNSNNSNKRSRLPLHSRPRKRHPPTPPRLHRTQGSSTGNMAYTHRYTPATLTPTPGYPRPPTRRNTTSRQLKISIPVSTYILSLVNVRCVENRVMVGFDLLNFCLNQLIPYQVCMNIETRCAHLCALNFYTVTSKNYSYM